MTLLFVIALMAPFVTFLVLYLVCRLSCGVTKSGTCLIGKTALVTGGNSGIGYKVCLNLASRGAKVIIADINDASASKKRIIEATKNPNVATKYLNLASLKSVRHFVKDLGEERIDILVNNAGIGASAQEFSEDGLNNVLQVNYFGPFLLTHLLIKPLKKSPSARIVFTSSLLAFLGRPDFETWNQKDKYKGLAIPPLKAYSDSKLATLMASDLFAEKLKPFGITSNSLHPGLCRTEIFKKSQVEIPSTLPLVNIFSALTFPLAKNSWEGSQTTVHLAVSSKLDQVTGEYFSDCCSIYKPPQGGDRKRMEELWRFSEDCVRLSQEERI